MVDDQENDIDEQFGEMGKLQDQKAQTFSSLDQLRFKLNKKSSPSLSIPIINPTSFDSLDPSIVQFRLSSNFSPPFPPDHTVCL